MGSNHSKHEIKRTTNGSIQIYDNYPKSHDQSTLTTEISQQIQYDEDQKIPKQVTYSEDLLRSQHQQDPNKQYLLQPEEDYQANSLQKQPLIEREEIPDDDSGGCCFGSCLFKGGSKSESNKKFKEEKLINSDWYQYLEEVTRETYQERSNMFKNIQLELKQKFKKTDVQKHQDILHQAAMESVDESILIHKKMLKKHMEQSNAIGNNPFMLQILNNQLLENLTKETELMGNTKISLDFEKSIKENETHNQMYNQQQNLRTYMRAGSTSQFRFKTPDNNMSILGIKKNQNNASTFHMNNATLILDSNQHSENEKIYTSINFYKIVTNLIEKQIHSKNLPIGFIKQYFLDYYLNKYDLEKKKIVQIEDLSGFISDFLDFYLEIISVYYDLNGLLDKFPYEDVEPYITEENMINYLNCILFSNDKFYQNVMGQITKNDTENVKSNFVENIKRMRNKPIGFFDIPVDFQLNQATIKYNEEKGNIFAEIEEYDDEESNASHIKSPVKKTNQNPFLKNYGIPYERVINYFKRLDQVRSPLHKLKIILKTTQMIDEEIKEFYKNNNIRLGKKVHYDADQFISLFVYIIVQAQSFNLYETCSLIQYFTFKDTLNSASGYLLVTLTGCVHHIAQLNVEQEAKCTIKDSYHLQSFFQTYTQSQLRYIDEGQEPSTFNQGIQSNTNKVGISSQSIDQINNNNKNSNNDIDNINKDSDYSNSRDTFSMNNTENLTQEQQDYFKISKRNESINTPNF